MRIRKIFEGQGHISALMRVIEQEAQQRGFRRLTIGAEAKEARNGAIYRHWGYDKLVLRAQEDGEEILYFEKTLLFSMDEDA